VILTRACHRYIRVEVQTSCNRLREDARRSERRDILLPGRIAHLRLRQPPHTHSSTQERVALGLTAMEGSVRLYLLVQYPERGTGTSAQQHCACARMVVQSKQEDAKHHGQQRHSYLDRYVVYIPIRTALCSETRILTFHV